ncbi:LysR family transcriptional regulator [uncultured Paracoccus sp.]|uniref:LysR family transcriptional regulator n=1 Tax=uncultured Paracoccus sp. TaxID=189685 RepID=UPI0025EC02C1|nr:LysR family transcriptional regulator [uncultured Paracoccus sp.]
MTTIKQIEAFYWSGQLGSFVSAASRLNTTQSNISKRIQELEYSLSVELFDRAKRAIRLTAKGEELMRLSEEMLRIHLQLAKVGKSAPTISGPFRFGVTESVALTWLTRLSISIQDSFDGLIPIAYVDTSANLNAMLLERKIDLAIATETNMDSSLLFKPLIPAERAWVASPSLIEHDRKLTAAELSALPMLGHGDISVTNSVSRFLKQNGVTQRIVAASSSLSALLRMAIQGVGITYLHLDLVADDVRAGRLKVISTDVELKPVMYVAAYRDDVISSVAELVATKAHEVCRVSAR